MAEELYISVLFRKTQKAYYVPCPVRNIRTGDMVVVKTQRGLEMGEVLEVCCEDEVDAATLIEGRVIRRFNKDDYRKLEYLERKEKKAYQVCQEEIEKLNLPMKLLDVEYLYDGKKAIFYFSAEGRVDFRELVKRLASRLRIKVEMRQVGVRDEAKMIGGLGPCGRKLCCASFLTRFESVSIRMAKDQGLPLNTFKISGLCGRLMCCLNYEQEIYDEFLRCAPAFEQEVITPDGKGRVVGYQVVKNSAEVELESGVRRIYPLDLLEWDRKCPEAKPGRTE